MDASFVRCPRVGSRTATIQGFDGQKGPIAATLAHLEAGMASRIPKPDDFVNKSKSDLPLLCALQLQNRDRDHKIDALLITSRGISHPSRIPTGMPHKASMNLQCPRDAGSLPRGCDRTNRMWVMRNGPLMTALGALCHQVGW